MNERTSFLQNGVAGVLVLLVVTSGLRAQPAVEFQPGKGCLDVVVGGKPRLRYLFAHDTSTPQRAHETYKPYHHVLGPDGKPITKGPGGLYTHHRGIFFGYMRVKQEGRTYDFWGMGRNAQVHQRFLDQKILDDGSALSSALIHWVTADGRTLIEEIRQVVVRPAQDAWLLADFQITVKPVAGDVVLSGDPEHGGFQYRPDQAVAETNSARYLFHADGVKAPQDRDLPWVAETYPLGDRTWTVQIMNHPDNPKPTIWSAYRPYGRFGCYVSDVALGKEQTWTVRYRVRVLEGDAPARASLAKAYEQFAREP